MADFSGVYDETCRRLCEFVSSLTEADQHRPVPATPGWTVHDVVAHLTGDLEAVQADNLPSSFFAALGDQEEVVKLNAWTGHMVEGAEICATCDVLSEWAQRTALADGNAAGRAAASFRVAVVR